MPNKEDSINIPVFLNNINLEEVTSEIEKQYKDAIKNGLLKPLNQSKTEMLGFIKLNNRYKSVLLKTYKNGEIRETKTRADFFTAKQAKSIWEGSYDLDSYKKQISLIDKNRQRSRKYNEEERKRQKREEARQSREEEKRSRKQDNLQERLNKIRYAVEFSKIAGEQLTPLEQNQLKMQSLKQQLKLSEEEYISARESNVDVSEITDKVKNLRSEISKLKEEIEKETKTSFIERLMNTIQRIGFYRIARNMFRLIENGFKQGITSLASFSDEANQTISSITSQFTILANSATVIIYPLLKMVEPVLKTITSAVADLASGLSYLAYKLGITSSWFKVNKDYMKEFNQQAQKFSFDKFEALSGENDSYNMFTEITGEDTSGKISNIATQIELIALALGTIEAMKFIGWLQGDGLDKIIEKCSKMKENLTGIKDKILNISNATTILSASLGFITSVINLISLLKNWDSASLVSKITGITAAVLGLASVIMTILALTGVGNVAIMKAIATGLGATATLLAGISAITVDMKANGGMVDSGSLFIAGERGAELVTTMPSGQTGVTNVAQFKQAMLEALYEWGGNFGSSGGGDVVLNLDGAEVARSKRFRAEVNRRNSGINLL